MTNSIAAAATVYCCAVSESVKNKKILLQRLLMMSLTATAGALGRGLRPGSCVRSTMRSIPAGCGAHRASALTGLPRHRASGPACTARSALPWRARPCDRCRHGGCRVLAPPETGNACDHSASAASRSVRPCRTNGDLAGTRPRDLRQKPRRCHRRLRHPDHARPGQEGATTCPRWCHPR